MRKQAVIFLLLAAVVLPAFAATKRPVVAPQDTSQLGPDAQLERRIVQAVYEKFGNVAAAHVWVQAKDGEVIVRGGFSEMMKLQVLNRVRRVDGVKSARWGMI
jgi:osmotically-inducible protein OsmY